jgi:hypothetical protein
LSSQVTLYNVDTGAVVWSLGGDGGSRPANAGHDIFKMVAGVCLAPSAHGFLVCDAQQNRVVHFDAAGAYVRTIGEGVLDCPMTVAANDTHVVVVSAKAHSIALFDAVTGAHVGTVGHRGTGSGPGDLAAPHGVVLLSDKRHLLVASRDTDAVVKFTLSGEYVASYGPVPEPYALVECGSSPGDFVVSSFSRHEVYSATLASGGGSGTAVDFKKLCGLGEESSAPGGFIHVTAMAVAPRAGLDTLFVVDQASGRCQMFS